MDGSRVTVGLAPPESASDDSYVARLVAIINAAYSTSEGDIFGEDYKRTDPAEVSQFIQGGEIAIATLTGTDSAVDFSSIIGCVRVQQLSATHGEFGMLALDMAHQGRGSGRDLVSFAEEECRRKGRTVMQVELLFPMWFELAIKLRLESWYQRLGYVLSKAEDFGQSYPHLARLLRGECEYRIYEKPLMQQTTLEKR